MSRTIKCECCGVEFETQRSDTKFCSKKCTNRNWREKNPEKIKASRAKWYINNKEKSKTWSAKWVTENKERRKAIYSKWRRENSEKAKKSGIDWKKENPEKNKAIKRKGVYRKLGYPEELLEIKELQYQIKKEIKNQLKGENNVNH